VRERHARKLLPANANINSAAKIFFLAAAADYAVAVGVLFSLYTLCAVRGGLIRFIPHSLTAGAELFE
jgi:hypothetical protein